MPRAARFPIVTLALTALVVAARLGRSFVGADASALAMRVTKQRLEREGIAVVVRRV